MYWFLLNALVVLFFVWFATKKYGTLLNPIGFIGAFYLMAAVVAPILYVNLGFFQRVSDHAINYTSLISSIYFAALGSAYVVRWSPMKKFFNRLFQFIRPVELIDKGSTFSDVGMLCQAVLLFIVLMVASGAGTLWITNPRLAYAMHRESVGVWWSLSEAALVMTFLCVIYRKARTFKAVLLYATGFAALAWFLGSKSDMLTYFILGLFYTHICIRKVANKTIVLAGVIVLLAFLTLQIYQGTAKDMLGALTYFDYFSNSALLIDRFKHFGFRYGAVTLSNIWFYVPRGLYHAKPYAYAQVIPDEFLYPGAARDGWTAGMMQWTQGYCDFGIAGAVVWGLFTGMASKGAYELLLERKDIQSMVLFGQIGLIYCVELFTPAPFLVFLVWLVIQIVLIRILSSIEPLPGLRRIRLTPEGSTSGAR